MTSTTVRIVAATHSSREGHVTRFISETMPRKKSCVARALRARAAVAAGRVAGVRFEDPARAGVPGPLGVDFMVCSYTAKNLAGRTGLEPATDGFGDRNSTN